jgi:hypothetical protein
VIRVTRTDGCSTKETPSSISVFGDGLHVQLLYTQSSLAQKNPICYARSLLLLTLPLETEGLVNPEFPAEGEEGHDDGNAGICQTTDLHTPHIANSGLTRGQ